MHYRYLSLYARLRASVKCFLNKGGIVLALDPIKTEISEGARKAIAIHNDGHLNYIRAFCILVKIATCEERYNASASNTSAKNQSN